MLGLIFINIVQRQLEYRRDNISEESELPTMITHSLFDFFPVDLRTLVQSCSPGTKFDFT